MTSFRQPPIFSALLAAGLFFCGNVRAGDQPFSLPPVMNREYGKVIVERGWSKKIRIHAATKNKGVTRLLAPKSASDADIAAWLLRDFWENNFRDNPIGEIIELDADKFAKNGTPLITGKKCQGDTLFHDWWRVRMGERLLVSKNYQLFAINIFHDDGGWEVGHFCIGIRKKGGDPENDIVIDFRAPWHHHRSATMKEAFNKDNSLINQIIVSNMYDWFYTQAEFRGCLSEISVNVISDEQARLLLALKNRDENIRANPFRPLRGNCASLGKQVMNRILPFDQGQGDRVVLADTPRRGMKLVERRFDGPLTKITLPSHQRAGLEPTSKSEIHPAPNRTTSAEFLQLKRELDP